MWNRWHRRRSRRGASRTRCSRDGAVARPPRSGCGRLRELARRRAGHRRLAIIDLSDAGYQPMISEDGSLGIVFNGAIYNFMEFRADLESPGYRFRSQ